MQLHKLISTGIYTGYSPVAPGTVGSVLGIFIFYFFNLFLNNYQASSMEMLILDVIVLISMSIVGQLAIKQIHKEWKHDDNRIVIDEIIGVGIAVLYAPFTWQYYLLAFVLFRIFDIWKPLFIKKIDNTDSDFSVILDDILAGVYANIVLQIIIYFNILRL